MNDLAEVYRSYIDCLNRQDWLDLGRYVDDDVSHNGQHIGVAGYRSMLEGNFRDIPDLRFRIALLICQPPFVACRLTFDCTPKGRFLDLDVDGRRVSFAENVFYAFEGDKIKSVWSVLDKAAIEDSLREMR